MTCRTKPESGTIENDAVTELETQSIPSVLALYENWQELLDNPKYDPELLAKDQNPVFKRHEDGVLELIGNEYLEALFDQVIPLGSDTQTVFRRARTGLSLAQAKLSNENDMTSQTREYLGKEIENGLTLCAFSDIVTEYINNRMEICKRFAKRDTLETQGINAIHLIDSNCLNGLRSRIAMLADQIGVIGALWRRNHNALTRLGNMSYLQ